MAFIRRFDSKKIDAMKETELWKDCLLPDILNGEVFPAIRDNDLDFYHSGGCMFRYSGDGFKFNRQYLKPEYQSPEVKKEWANFNIPEDLIKKPNGESIDGNPVSLKNITLKIPSFDFCEQYHNIKLVVAEKFKGSEGAALERKYLSALYPATFGEPEISDENNSAVKVIDIEVRANFETDTEKAEKAKCDLMLLNTETHELQFVEAKLSSNKEVKSKAPGKPVVIEQVKKYNSWLSNKKDRKNIVENYQNYLKIMNQLFDKNYEMPKTIKESAKLVIFEETDEHRKNHLPKLLEPDAIGAENIVIFEKDEVVLKEDKVVFKKGVKFALERIWQENCSK